MKRIALGILLILLPAAWSFAQSVCFPGPGIGPFCTTTAGSTFTETFDSSALCWASGSSSCIQLWKSGGGTQEIVASPGTPPANTACAKSLKIIKEAGTASYLYTVGSMPKMSAGTAYDRYDDILIESQVINQYNNAGFISECLGASTTDCPGRLALYNPVADHSAVQIYAVGSSNSAKIDASFNTWHTVHRRIEPTATAANSYIERCSNSTCTGADDGACKDGAAETATCKRFTAASKDVMYNIMGSTSTSYAYVAYVGDSRTNSALGGGISTSAFIDFETSSNGTALTTAILNASTHCGNGTWTASYTSSAMTISTEAQFNVATPVVSCGATYNDSASTRGIKYDLSKTDGTGYGFTTLSSKASIGYFFKTDLPTNDTGYASFHGIANSTGTDFVAFMAHQGQFYIESHQNPNGNPDSGSKYNYTPGTLYWVTYQFVAGGTHSLAIYAYNGGTGTWDQVSLQTKAAEALTLLPSAINFGRADGATGAYSAWFDNIKLDYVNGTFPLLP